VQQAESLLDRITHLPSLPPALARISAIVSNPDISIAEIAEALKLDPGICSKVLRLANSAYVGIPRTVSSLNNAVVLLGQHRIQSLVFATTTLSALGRASPMPFANIDFWRHSMTTALVCESIARHLKRYDTVEAGELFCAGILHDVGKLALGAFEPARITAAQKKAAELRMPFFKAEDLELSHFTVGALLAQRWNFPPDLRNAILYHHDPSGAAPFTKMAAIVHLGDIMAHIMGYRTHPEEIGPSLDESVMVRIELPPERLRVIAAAAIEDEQKLESLIAFVK
jgi:putative nucleotidyltransferase with HDIG domain